MISKVRLYYTKIMMIMAMFGLGFIIFMMVYPFQTAEYLNSPFPVLNEKKEVEIGEVLQYRMHYIQHSESPATLTREIIHRDESDGNRIAVYTYPPIESRLPKGENIVEVSRETIPDAAPCGRVYLNIIAQFNNNALNHHVIEARTEDFTIVCKGETKIPETVITPIIRGDSPQPEVIERTEKESQESNSNRPQHIEVYQEVNQESPETEEPEEERKEPVRDIIDPIIKRIGL